MIDKQHNELCLDCGDPVDDRGMALCNRCMENAEYMAADMSHDLTPFNPLSDPMEV